MKEQKLTLKDDLINFILDHTTNGIECLEIWYCGFDFDFEVELKQGFSDEEYKDCLKFLDKLTISKTSDTIRIRATVWILGGDWITREYTQDGMNEGEFWTYHKRPNIPDELKRV